MTLVIKECFSLSLTFICPHSPFGGHECFYSKHQLFVALNDCPFPALASSAMFCFPRQTPGSVKQVETKSRFEGLNVFRELCSLQ